MQHPLEHLLAWYKSTPLDHQQDIAALIGISCSGFEALKLNESLDVLVSGFIQAVENSRDGKFREVAMILMLKAFIEFFFIEKRSSLTDWQEAERTLSNLAKAKSSATFEAKAREMKFRGAQWRSTCEKWNELVSAHLSNEQLRALIA